MKDKDNILLEHFLQEKKREIADDGFTRKVMNRLPRKSYEKELFRLNLFWNVSCVIAFVLLFYVLDGWNRLAMAFENQLRMMKYTLAEECPSELEHLLYRTLSSIQDPQVLQHLVLHFLVYILAISAFCIYRIYKTE